MSACPRLRHGISGPLHVGVLPEAQDEPALAHEVRVGLAIPLDIASQLSPPPGCVADRLGRVVRASMPEAPVDEDGDARAREEDVGATAREAGERMVDAVAQAAPVQSPS